MLNKDEPAFPIPLSDGERWIGPGNGNGMSLRDWFAGQALTGAVASRSVCLEKTYPTYLAKASYRIADAMMQERINVEPT